MNITVNTELLERYPCFTRELSDISEIVIHGTGGGVGAAGLLRWMLSPQGRIEEYKKGVGLFHFVIDRGQKSEPLDGEQEWMTLAEKSYEDEVFRTYKVSQTKDIETLLTTAADAQTKATNVMEQSKTVGVTVTRSLPLVYADIDIEDMITASHHRYRADREPGLYRVIGTALDLKNKKVQVTMKFIEEYTTAETEYHMEVDSGGDFIIDSDGAFIIAGL